MPRYSRPHLAISVPVGLVLHTLLTSPGFPKTSFAREKSTWTLSIITHMHILQECVVASIIVEVVEVVIIVVEVVVVESSLVVGVVLAVALTMVLAVGLAVELAAVLAVVVLVVTLVLVLGVGGDGSVADGVGVIIQRCLINI